MFVTLKGKKLSEEIEGEIVRYVEDRKNKGLASPKLAAILVGNDGGSIFYTNYQEKICKKLGIEYECKRLSADCTCKDLKDIIKDLNLDSSINGIMLLLPLPGHINQGEVISEISPEKDVDGLTTLNTGRMYKGENSFVPCTPQSVMRLIKSTGIDISGKEAVVIGRSNIVGKPVANLLLSENATVTICHSKTKDLMNICKRADILVSCIGRPQFINENYVKEGAIIIDVGTTEVDGQMVGDVNFDKVKGIASYITPVPGGVGSLTTNILFLNTCISSGMK